ncbi:MAG: TPM domain-containing protein [Xanthomonadales bacterium]|nr:TPM domain-containing protein [Xanthomonadales bacterium]
MRWLAHLLDFGRAARCFPPQAMDAIQHAIAASESTHLGEIVFAVEGSLPLADILRRRSARQRAEEVFARLRVWDTEANTGVLVYVLLADRAIEIVADRGAAAAIRQAEWQPAIELMRAHLARGEYETGAIAGIAAVSELLARHFPADGRANPDELPDRPVLL